MLLRRKSIALLLYIFHRVPRSKSCIAQVFDCLAVTGNVRCPLYVLVARQALDKYDRRHKWIFAKLQQNKIALLSCIRTSIEPYNLNSRCTLALGYEHSLELSGH